MSKQPKEVPVPLRATRRLADDIDEWAAERGGLSRSAAWRYLAAKGLDLERRGSTTANETTAA